MGGLHVGLYYSGSPRAHPHRQVAQHIACTLKQQNLIFKAVVIVPVLVTEEHSAFRSELPH